MTTTRKALLAVTTMLLLGGCGWLTAPREGVEERFLTVGGISRRYEWKAPDGITNAPVIIAFHGLAGTATAMRQLTSLHRLAMEEGYAIVYAEAAIEGGRGWSMGCQDCTNADVFGIDDVAYVDAVLDDLAQRTSINKNEIYATGFSMGAWFTYVLACKRAGRVKAIVPVAGLMPRPVAAACTPAQPVDVLVIMGDEDPTQPFGGRPDPFGLFGADSSASFWADVAQCEATDPNPPNSHGATHVGVVRWTGCTGNARVERHRVIGMPHLWPDNAYSANAEVMRTFARR